MTSKKPTMKIHINDFIAVVEYDTEADTSYMEQPGFEKELEDQNNDLISAYSVYAKAYINIPISNTHSIVQEIRTPGLHSVMLYADVDPMDDSYVKEVISEEYDLLIDMLTALNVTVEGV